MIARRQGTVPKPLARALAAGVLFVSCAASHSTGGSVEASVRSSAGPVCRAMHSLFVVRAPASGADAVPHLDDTLAAPTAAYDPSCQVHAMFRDAEQQVEVALGDDGTSLITADLASKKARRTFHPTEHSLTMRGRFGDTPWSTELTAGELGQAGIGATPVNLLDVSSVLPIVVRVRHCVGDSCEDYHSVDAIPGGTPACTSGLEMHMVDDALGVTPPVLQRCLTGADGVALAVFPESATRRVQNLSISVPGLDLPALIVPLPPQKQQVLSLDVLIRTE